MRPCGSRPGSGTRQGTKTLSSNHGLIGTLVAVSTVLDATFPEYPIWKREVENRRAKQERKMKDMRSFLLAPASPTPLPKPSPLEEHADFSQQKPAPITRAEKKVGRNDPCPCGSGKKFKKCCMNKDKD